MSTHVLVLQQQQYAQCGLNWPIVLAFGIIKVNYHQIQPQEDNILYFRYDNIHLNT